MRLSGLALAAVLLFSSYLLAQHSSGGSGGGGSAGGSSSGGGSHSSGSSGSSYSGGASSGGHSSGGYSASGGSHGSGGSHSSGGGHSSSGGHFSGNSSSSRGSGSGGKNDHGSLARTAAPARSTSPEKRGFFSVLFHPFRKAQPKPEPKAALYLPRPICPKGRCAPPCPVGQGRSGGACSNPVILTCVPGQFWSGHSCAYTRDHQCRFGQIWDGTACTIGAPVLDSCFAQRSALERQIQRVQAAESIRQNACASGAGQECSQATSTWQSEENLRQSLLARYQQCQTRSSASYSPRSDPYVYRPALWFDSLRFNGVF